MRFGVRVLASASLIGAIAAGSIELSQAESSAQAEIAPAQTRASIDDNGNLIVYHASGYKQIIIGGGDVLERRGVSVDELFSTPAAANHSDSIIYPGNARSMSSNSVVVIRPPVNEEPAVVYGDCIYGTAVVRGRSFMYGVDRGQTPQIANDCE
jgi:hypothetical protein